MKSSNQLITKQQFIAWANQLSDNQQFNYNDANNCPIAQAIKSVVNKDVIVGPFDVDVLREAGVRSSAEVYNFTPWLRNISWKLCEMRGDLTGVGIKKLARELA